MEMAVTLTALVELGLDLAPAGAARRKTRGDRLGFASLPLHVRERT
jgi:hypothetical protein